MARKHVPVPEPWYLPGLPHGLTAEHFERAARIILTNEPEFMPGPSGAEMKPLLGDKGKYVGLSGSHYPENVERLERLHRLTPLGQDRFGGAIYPAILCTDPTPTVEDGTKPLGVTSSVGYVGSAWAQRANHWAAMMTDRGDRMPSTFWVTRPCAAQA